MHCKQMISQKEGIAINSTLNLDSLFEKPKFWSLQLMVSCNEHSTLLFARNLLWKNNLNEEKALKFNKNVFFG
jgi:hypothetical protein